MKKLNVFLISLFFVSLIGLFFVASNYTDINDRHNVLNDQANKLKDHSKKNKITDKSIQQQNLVTEFFKIYNTYDSLEQFNLRQRQLKHTVTKHVLNDPKLFPDLDDAQRRFLTTNGLQSRSGRINYYPKSSTEGVAVVEVKGKYDNEEEDNVGSTTQIYQVQLNKSGTMINAISFTGSEFVLSDSTLNEALNND
ncbi:hypothetical protein [Weissella minor]|uniref:hypothetical protein n=1 Tax=Weissella minor TaxID=1620 RepID=UPI003AF2710A